MSLPEYLDVPLDGVLSLGAHGRAHLIGAEHWTGGRLELAVVVEGIRVYDVWVQRGDGWAQLRREGGHWVHDHLEAAVGTARFWIAPLDPRAAGAGPAPEVETAEIRPYVPIADGEPPLPGERTQLPSRLMRWVHARTDDIVVAAMLEEWTDAAGEAAALGWMCGMPRGDDLLMAYAHSPGAADRVAGHDAAFARWLVATLGQQVRSGLIERRDAESRRAALENLVAAVGRLVRALDPGFRVEASPPVVVGPRERHRWLVDEPLAARLANPVMTEGAHRPVFVVRPLLIGEQGVLLEGLVV